MTEGTVRACSALRVCPVLECVRGRLSHFLLAGAEVNTVGVGLGGMGGGACSS